MEHPSPTQLGIPATESLTEESRTPPKAVASPMNNLNPSPFTVPNPESTGVLLTSYERQDASQGLSGSPVVRRPLGEPIPLSIAQQQVWLHGQLAPDVPLYNEVLILERVGPLNQEVLERSFREVIRRHETLRTTFAVEDGSPAQLIAEHHEMELP